MSKVITPVVLFFSLFCFGCAGSSQSFVQPQTNLNGYRYVFIGALKYDDGSIDKYEVAARLAQMFTSKGLKALNDHELESLPMEQLGQVLYCTVAHRSGPSSGAMSTGSQTVNMECYDYAQNKVYGGVGEFGYGSDNYADLYGALENAFKGFAKNYTRYDPSVSKNPIAEMRSRFKNWEKVDLDEPSLRKQLKARGENVNPLEGIWTSLEDNGYQIGIVKDTARLGRDFVAFVLKTENPLWLPKQIKIEFQATAYRSTFTTTYFMSDHSKQGTTAFIKDNGLLEMSLRNPDGTELKTSFIKNFPSFNSKNRIGFTEGEEETSSGSGFLLSKSGLVVTNWHVVKNGSTIKVVFPQINKSFKANVVIKDASNDIAVIRLAEFKYSQFFAKDIPYSLVSSQSIKQGQKVYTLGFPLGDILGSTVKLSDGVVSSIYGPQDDPRLIQISNPIQPGNSGGPLLNAYGEVLGIVVATLNAKFFYENADIIPQNVNFAVKSDYLLNLVSMLPEEADIKSQQSRLRDQSLEMQVDRVAPFMANVIAK